MAPRRYLVISDTHLADVEDHADGWKRFKGEGFVRDQEFLDLVRRFMAEARPGEESVLVLNGDIFDFCITTRVPEPAPWRMRRRERTRGLEPSEPKAAWKLGVILEQHPVFVTALAELLGRGHRVIYVLGNHDHELHWPSVQAVLEGAIRDRAAQLGLDPSASSIRYEPWFYYDPAGLYVEHGHQFDIYSSFPHILNPTATIDGEEILALPLGGFSNRYLVSILGYFNPRSTDYINNLPGYFAHWLRYYAFSHRSILFGWFLGTMMVLVRVMRLRNQLWKQARGHARAIVETARRYGLPWHAVWCLDQLKPVPIYFRTFRILREFWLDRVGLVAGLTALVAGAFLLLPGPPLLRLIPLLIAAVITMVLYERSVATSGVFAVNEEAPGYARAITQLLPAKVVVMGHTHQPALIRLGADSFFVNTGTWAPMFTWRTWFGPDPGSCHAFFVSFDGDAMSLDLQVISTEPGARPVSVVPIPAPDRRYQVDEEQPLGAPKRRKTGTC